MTVIRTTYSLDEQVIALNTLNAHANGRFTVEAIRIDKHGTQYLLREPKKEFPESSGCQWTRESEIQPQERQR